MYGTICDGRFRFRIYVLGWRRFKTHVFLVLGDMNVLFSKLEKHGWGAGNILASGRVKPPPYTEPPIKEIASDLMFP